MIARSLRATAVAAALTAAAVVSVPSSAHADNGDGRPDCAHGEICFWYNAGNTYQKQFWYTGDHGGNNFMYYNGSVYRESSERVQDNALHVTNRDTQCRIRVGDLSGGLWTWRYFPNDNGRYHLGEINNRNDRHERCV